MGEAMFFFRAYRDALSYLPEKDQLEALWAMLDYGLDGKEPEGLSPVARAVFTVARPSIAASNARREDGKKGGRPRKKRVVSEGEKTMVSENAKPLVSEKDEKHETMPSHDIDKDIDIDEDKDRDREEDKDKDEESERAAAPRPRARFAPPKVEELRAYAAEKELDLDAEQFLDYYASKGWLVGKSPMKDWRAAARSWARRERASPKPERGFRRILTDADYEKGWC